MRAVSCQVANHVLAPAVTRPSMTFGQARGVFMRIKTYFKVVLKWRSLKKTCLRMFHEAFAWKSSFGDS